jgi:hypothetical protein
MVLHMKIKRDPGLALAAIKTLHTVVWVFFVACIVAVPAAAAARKFQLSAFFAGFVLLECLVLAVNRCRCPLTDVAARYAPEGTPNFDIYLPAWVARYNKQIFGAIFALGVFFALVEWLMATR